jgi:hypothetical protein
MFTVQSKALPQCQDYGGKMDRKTQATLKEIFEAHGYDPFIALLTDKSQWPAEARKLVENSERPERQPSNCTLDPTEEAARAGGITPRSN